MNQPGKRPPIPGILNEDNVGLVIATCLFLEKALDDRRMPLAAKTVRSFSNDVAMREHSAVEAITSIVDTAEKAAVVAREIQRERRSDDA